MVLHFAWILAAVYLAACQQTGSMSDGSDSTSNSTVLDTPERPSEASPQASTVIDSPGKPLPPIEFKYEFLGEPAVGQPLEIRVTSTIEAELDALNVTLSGSERMQVPAAIARFRMARTAAGAPMTRTISVTPLASGTIYLDVLLQADIDGRQQSRAVTIPIRVGAPSRQSESEGTVSTDADGQRIISLPAEDN
jgi:hypothetical protein